MQAKAIKTERQVLLAATALSVVLWLVPFGFVVTLPLLYLNTHVHEMFHAWAAVASNGVANYIVVNADGSGMTPITGGNILLIGSAGYLGSSALGAMLIASGGTERGARFTLWTLAALMAYGLIVWVRGDVVGVLSGILWMAGLVTMALALRGAGLLFAAQFLGVQLCLASLQALLALLHISALTGQHSDALLLQEVTGIPALAWALLWSGIGLLLSFAGIRFAWRRTQAAAPQGSASRLQ